MIQAIIIDDEKKCIALLEKMIKQSFPDINVAAVASQPEEGIRLIRQYEPDLVFLDIEMPRKNGFELLEATRDLLFDVVFTTAYNEFAIKAIRFSALDYLLKPVDAEELAKAIERFRVKHQSGVKQEQFDMFFSTLRNLSQPYRKISISTAEGVIFIHTPDILYFESTGSYSALYLKNDTTVMTTKNLKDFEEMLSDQAFCRIHHSYLINLNEIKRYTKGEGGAVVMSNGTELAVSKRKKEEFLKKLHL